MEGAKLIFALDVGTRSVVGLAVSLGEHGGEIKGSVMVEHQVRSMQDGQIHDVPKVAAVVKQVKQALEDEVGVQFDQVAVAAAGRTLKTTKASAEIEVDRFQIIDKEQVKALEIMAVKEAQRTVGLAKESAMYYCVGYSVIDYQLDGSPIGNLVGQNGSTIGVEVIATFLPRVVVDSLHNVLELAGLSMASLTLEPIAALDAVINPNMRKLNLALVDVGAGTSDIAVTEGGTVKGYAMVPLAGDEISESICNHYLVDFLEAEQMKRRLIKEEEISYVDVLGNRRTVSSKEVIAVITPTVESVAKKIAEAILEVNGHSPQAVICVGGGSQTPLLTSKIAAALDLTEDRVGVRGREVLAHITGDTKDISGPQCVTPLGIAMTAFANKHSFQHVYVKGRLTRVFNLGKTTVADALLAVGVEPQQMLGKIGDAISIKVNGQVKFIKGKPGKPIQVTCNGIPVKLDDPIKHGDRLDYVMPQPGEPGKAYLKEVLPPLKPRRVIVNGQQKVIEPIVTLNGKKADPHTLLKDKDQIEIEELKTVGKLLAFLGYTVEGREILLNGRSVSLNRHINDGDELEVKELVRTTSIMVTVNDQPVSIEATGDSCLFNQIFRYIDFPRTPPPGKKKLVMEINGEPAGFTSIIKQGDVLKLQWE